MKDTNGIQTPLNHSSCNTGTDSLGATLITKNKNLQKKAKQTKCPPSDPHDLHPVHSLVHLLLQKKRTPFIIFTCEFDSPFLYSDSVDGGGILQKHDRLL
jgi:hypothetical protein